MSLEHVLRTLQSFGIEKKDAEVYICLAKKGPKKGTDLSSILGVTEQQLCSSLEILQNKGIVTAKLEHTALFYAIPFERVIDLCIKTNTEQAYAIQETKKELLDSWQEITTGDSV